MLISGITVSCLGGRRVRNRTVNQLKSKPTTPCCTSHRQFAHQPAHSPTRLTARKWGKKCVPRNGHACRRCLTGTRRAISRRLMCLPQHAMLIRIQALLPTRMARLIPFGRSPNMRLDAPCGNRTRIVPNVGLGMTCR